MSSLIRWEPWREMPTLRRAFGRFLDEPFEPRFPVPWWLGEYEPAVDVIEEENVYIVKANVPGIKPEELEVTLQDNVLTIKGETKAEKEIDEENYHLRERRYGSFMRRLTLPAHVRPEEIDAKHEDGVLTLRLPKVEEEKPKKIAVKVMGNGKK